MTLCSHCHQRERAGISRWCIRCKTSFTQVRRGKWSDEEVASLRRHAEMGSSMHIIARLLGKKRAQVNAKLRDLGLPEVDTINHIRESRVRHYRRVGNLRHRASLRFGDPIRLRIVPGCPVPIRDIDPEVRRLIDDALAARSPSRRKHVKGRA